MKNYPNINYSFAPETYWSDGDPLAAILRNVTGENRRQMIRDYLDAGQLDQIEEALLPDELAEAKRNELGRIHPSFMGGEYLPGYLPVEVEIARICLQSTTSDVISLRAHPTSVGTAYRIVDEYEGEFTLPIEVSAQPLTLAQLIHQFEEGSLKELDYGGGLALGYNNMNADGGSSCEELRHFTRIESDLYPQLEEHFEHVFSEWLTESVAERDREDSEETV